MKIPLIFLMMALSPVKAKNHEYTTDDIKNNTTEFKAENLSKNEYAYSEQGNVKIIFDISISKQCQWQCILYPYTFNNIQIILVIVPYSMSLGINQHTFIPFQ